MTILQIAVPGPFLTALDYLAPKNWQFNPSHLACRVKVPLRNKEVVGICLGEKKESATKKTLKPIIEFLEDTPALDEEILKLARFASQYYHSPIGEALLTALPSLLRKPKAFDENTWKPFLITKQESEPLIKNPGPKLNTEQTLSLKRIRETKGFRAFLLYGITGSGKTEVYLRAIEDCLLANKQALILIPEIGLTPQTLQRFESRFNVPIAVIHSSLSEKEKLKSWYQARMGMAKIVIGTRSALFTGMPNLGLIIVDEEHDLSFKQQDGFRYSAKDLAIFRAQQKHIPIILGSATPSLESIAKLSTPHYEKLSLTQRAGSASLPKLRLIDLRNKPLQCGLAPALIDSMKQHLAEKKQVLLFLNRRGFSPRLLCHTCGYLAQCERCDAPYIFHQNPDQLHCHHCHTKREVYPHCPHCQSHQWLFLGQGTQKLEAQLASLFPNEMLVRVDRDNTQKKQAMDTLLSRIQSGEGRILIGTQMLAKGHHFPQVTLVALLDIDGGLSSQDFRATERMAQLILQVSGRAGRDKSAGEVIIQTHFPDHPLLQILLNQGYLAFAEAALAERLKAGLPPFEHMALLRTESSAQGKALQHLHSLKSKLPHVKQVRFFGPFAAPMEKKAGRYRAQMIIQSPSRSQLHQTLTQLQNTLQTLKLRCTLDVDPLDVF